MRKIQFRGKTENGEWVYGSLIQRIDCTEIHDSVFTWFILPETVGQFTGLIDKHGKEIYEGDYSEDGYIITFYNQAFQLCSLDNKGNVVQAIPSWAFKPEEIIGNIHDDTPELLTKNQINHV